MMSEKLAARVTRESNGSNEISRWFLNHVTVGVGKPDTWHGSSSCWPFLTSYCGLKSSIFGSVSSRVFINKIKVFTQV